MNGQLSAYWLVGAKGAINAAYQPPKVSTAQSMPAILFSMYNSSPFFFLFSLFSLTAAAFFQFSSRNFPSSACVMYVHSMANLLVAY